MQSDTNRTIALLRHRGVVDDQHRITAANEAIGLNQQFRLQWRRIPDAISDEMVQLPTVTDFHRLPFAGLPAHPSTASTPDILGAARRTYRQPSRGAGQSRSLAMAGVKLPTGSRLQSSGSSQSETLCILNAVSQARQVAYNVVALETGQPKSPSGANEQH